MIKNKNGKYDVKMSTNGFGTPPNITITIKLDRIPNIGEYIIYNDTTYKYIKL